jgi:DNA-binding transcriptional LysR family regulator
MQVNLRRASRPTHQKRAVLGQLSDMDLRLLRVFRSVVECGGMAAAELELNIGTSTISRHIKDLETRLGLTLCRRGRGGFALTPEGQRMYAETLRLLAATDALSQQRGRHPPAHGRRTPPGRVRQDRQQPRGAHRTGGGAVSARRPPRWR